MEEGLFCSPLNSSAQRREANIHGTISLQWWIVATAFIVWENDEVLIAQISSYFLLGSICINKYIYKHTRGIGRC